MVDVIFMVLQGRLPVLCWFNVKKGNFIMRCAQPKTGPAFKVRTMCLFVVFFCNIFSPIDLAARKKFSSCPVFHKVIVKKPS